MIIARPWLFLVGSVIALASCSPFELQQGVVGDKTPRAAGDQLELVHFPTNGFARLKPGFYLLDQPQNWPSIFKDVTRDFAMPKGPVIDANNMGFVAIGTDWDSSAIVVERVVKSPTDVLHVYVDQEKRGDNCEPPPPTNVLRAEAHEPPIDVVTFARQKLPIVVHLDRVKGLSCDPVPKVAMRCNVHGKAANDMSRSLSASPGDTVECDGTKVTTKVGYVTERNWFFERKPADSFVDLIVDDEHTHASFTVDAFGEYRVRMDAVDDRHKSGDKTVDISVAPAADVQIIQVGWTLHDKVDPQKLPKIEPTLVELGTGRECSAAHVQPWCEVKTSGITKQIMIHTQKGARYQLKVLYGDARAPQMPVLCARAFVNSAPVAVETCDFKERDANETWSPGTFNQDTGAFAK